MPRLSSVTATDSLGPHRIFFYFKGFRKRHGPVFCTSVGNSSRSSALLPGYRCLLSVFFPFTTTTRAAAYRSRLRTFWWNGGIAAFGSGFLYLVVA